MLCPQGLHAPPLMGSMLEAGLDAAQNITSSPNPALNSGAYVGGGPIRDDMGF